MNPDTIWLVSRLPIFLLGLGIGALLTAALREARRERVLRVGIYRHDADGQLREMERRRVAEGAA